jgi:plasmid stabilization system protein ParE
MSLPVRLTAAAEQDIILARLWYLEEAPHMVGAFEEELRSGYRRIADQPKMYQSVEADVRAAPIRRFPFSIYYKILPEWIEILGVLHQARDPRKWRKRL